jgi:hypothetical protein
LPLPKIQRKYQLVLEEIHQHSTLFQDFLYSNQNDPSKQLIEYIDGHQLPIELKPLANLYQ